jgi:hypothetical protein
MVEDGWRELEVKSERAGLYRLRKNAFRLSFLAERARRGGSL